MRRSSASSTGLIRSDGAPKGLASLLTVVMVGHVDHGKSTIVGRFLAEVGALPRGKMEDLRQRCDRTGRRFEYAFVVDALREEQVQGMTIDSARISFRTKRRSYQMVDAPGHTDLLKNMITGASGADAACVVIDAEEGIGENSRRHAVLLSLLGVDQIVVLVNKMDRVEYREARFEEIRQAFGPFLAQAGLPPVLFVPVSGAMGDNLRRRSERMEWYGGATVLEIVESFEDRGPRSEGPFRMPVQGVYKFNGRDDGRRIIAGTVESGTMGVGDEVVFFPSGKRARVRSIDGFPQSVSSIVSAGQAVGFTLEEPIFVTRGEIATRGGPERPHVSTRFLARLFWIHPEALAPGREIILKLATARAVCRLEKIVRVMDALSLQSQEGAKEVVRNEIAECVIATDRAIAFDSAQRVAGTGRFVLVERSGIAGGGIIVEALADERSEKGLFAPPGHDPLERPSTALRLFSHS